MTRHLYALLPLLLPLATSVQADAFDPLADTGWLEAGYEESRYDSLRPGRSFDPYRITSVSGSLTHKNAVWYGELAFHDRFNTSDTQLLIGSYQPVTATGQLHVEAYVTEDADFRPRLQAYAGWYQKLPAGFTVEPGYQTSRYPAVNIDRYSLATEKYLGAFRIAHHIGLVQVSEQSEISQRLQLDWYRGERARVGIGMAWGDDQEQEENGDVTVRPVRSYFATLVQPVSPRLDLTASLQTARYDDLYRQNGGRVGLRYHY